MTSLDTALAYIGRGWSPVPIPHKTKRPTLDGWPGLRISAETAPRYFNGKPQNIGVLMGVASAGLTDVDLDCPEVVTASHYLAPETGAIFGRAGRRASHRLYVTSLASEYDGKAIEFWDPVLGVNSSGGMLCEIRIGGGGKGAQTVFPGSTHESGEEIAWETRGEPAAIDGAELRKHVERIAAAALLARDWSGGKRHAAALTIGGMLARSGWNVSTIKLFVEAVARAAGDTEPRDRIRAAEDAATNAQKGGTARGFPALKDLFGEPVAKAVATWLRYEPVRIMQEDEGQARAELEYERQAHDYAWGEDRFDSGFGAGEKPAEPPFKITATPFTWRDPKTFPRRRWLYGHHLIRKFISCTVAPGGLGKSSLILVEAIALVTGRPLLGTNPSERKLTVWVLNLEDPQEEIERRVTAILIHYRIDPAEIEGRLFLDSGRHLKLIVAELTRGGTVILRPVVDAFKAEISARKVDVVMVDPFVKSHRVPENDNGAIDMVATVYADIADACDCAFDLVHHVRKTGGGEITVEDGRGAVALLGAVRSARVLNGMSKEEAEQVGDGTNHREFFRVSNGKLNMAPPPPDKADWYRLVSVSLGNGSPEPDNQWAIPVDDGDRVQCVTGWEMPDPMAKVTVTHLRATQALIKTGDWMEAVQAKGRWVGAAVAQAMGLDYENAGHKTTIKAALKQWYASGALVKVRRPNAHREEKTFVEVGERADD